MFSMCSELTPCARFPDTRIPQLMQPWSIYYVIRDKGGGSSLGNLSQYYIGGGVSRDPIFVLRNKWTAPSVKHSDGSLCLDLTTINYMMTTKAFEYRHSYSHCHQLACLSQSWPRTCCTAPPPSAPRSSTLGDSGC